MAKKAPAKKHRFAAVRKGGAKKPAPKAKKAPKDKPIAPKRPRSQALPGMEQARHQVLDHAFEQIGEGRDLMAQGRRLEQEGVGVALQYMQKHKVSAYRHAGVEGAFVEGVSKLRVRMTKDAENAAGADTTAHEAVDEMPQAPGFEPEFGEDE